jgi:hypothetical protein
VSPFAAGCAICGTDLEAARAKLAARKRVELPSTPQFTARADIDWGQVLIALALALALAPVGFLLAVYWALQRWHYGERAMTALMAAAAALSVASMLAPFWFWNHLL